MRQLHDLAEAQTLALAIVDTLPAGLQFVSADGALIEALGPGIRRNTLAGYKGTQYTVVHIEASDEDRKEMVAFAEHWVGGEYDWARIVSITLSLLTRFRSRQADSYGAKVLAALRNEFGGHAVKTE